MTGDMPRGYSIRARGLGGARNGMPPPRDYAYRGAGKDVLTTPGVMASWARRVRGAAGPQARDREIIRAEQEIALRGAAAPGQAPRPVVPVPGARRAASGAPLAPVTPSPGRSPVAQAAPVPAAVPEPAREAAPERCRRCRYLVTATGHKVACGDGAA